MRRVSSASSPCPCLRCVPLSEDVVELPVDSQDVRELVYVPYLECIQGVVVEQVLMLALRDADPVFDVQGTLLKVT